MAVEREILEFHGLCDHGCGPARIRHSQIVKGRKYPTALLCESCDREHWLQSDHKPTTADQAVYFAETLLDHAAKSNGDGTITTTRTTAHDAIEYLIDQKRMEIVERNGREWTARWLAV